MGLYKKIIINNGIVEDFGDSISPIESGLNYFFFNFFKVFHNKFTNKFKNKENCIKFRDSKQSIYNHLPITAPTRKWGGCGLI